MAVEWMHQKSEMASTAWDPASYQFALHYLNDCDSFARRTFTTPKIRTFATPKNRTFARRKTATPNFFLLFLAHFSWLFRLTAHVGHQGWEGGGA